MYFRFIVVGTSIRHFFFNYDKYNELDMNKKEFTKIWLDYESFENPLRLFNRYDIFGDVSNFFKWMSS